MDLMDGDDEEFGFSRNYFLAKELGGSAKKSSRKISDIKIVDEQDLRSAASKLAPKHEREMTSLLKSYKSLYSKWAFELRCGFSLLMYGYGSKRALIEDFASTALTDSGVVVINGYLQSINIKQAVVAVAETLRDQLKTKRRSLTGNISMVHQSFSSLSMDDLFAFLEGSKTKDNDYFVCVVIHNIDGPALRDCESQQSLARMASCSHIRMVASIDNVNAPLLWDKKMVHTQFSWCWSHVPTFAPYKVEGVFFPLVLINDGKTQNAKTAAIVLQSLTPNAQSVFKVLAEYQLAHSEEAGKHLQNSLTASILLRRLKRWSDTFFGYIFISSPGMPVSFLYTICKERFLVSSQITLNSYLTEFKDHELVKIRRHADGHDCFYIPLASEELEELLQEIG